MTPEDPSLAAKQFIEWQGLPLAYTDEGSGPVAVVAVPGLPGSSRDYRWLAPVLTPQVRTVRVDPPGFGDSQRASFRPMTPIERAAMVVDLMDRIGVERAYLVGHSAGGAVVSSVAHTAPERVLAVAYVASAGVRAHFDQRIYRAFSYAYRNRITRAPLEPLQRRLYLRLGFPDWLTDDERSYSTVDAAVMDFARHGRDVAAMTMPALVAWGETDRVIPESVSLSLAEIAPQGPRLAIPDGGHNIQKSHAVELGELILAHLDELV